VLSGSIAEVGAVGLMSTEFTLGADSGQTASAEARADVRSVLLSGGSRLVALPLAATFGLLATRITIDSVGSHAFGYVSVIATCVALLPFADLGLGAAIANATAQSDDPSTDARLFGVLLTSLRALCVSALVIVAASVLVATTVGWGTVLGISGSGIRWANLSSVAVFVLFALSLPLSVGQRLLLGAGRNHFVVVAGAVSAPVALCAAVLLARLQAPAAFFALAPVLGLFATSLLALAIARRITRIDVWHVLSQVPRPRTRRGLPVRATALPMFVILMGLPLALQSDRLVISHLSTSSALAAYSLAAPLFASLWAVLSTAGLALWPIFAARRRPDRKAGSLTTRRLWLMMLAGFAASSTAAAAALVLAGPALLDLVSGNRIAVPRPVLVGFGVLLVVQALHLPSGMLMTDPAGLRFQAVTVMAMLVVNLPVSIWATSRYGPVGPLIGSICGVCLAQLLPGLVRVGRLTRLALAQPDSAPVVGTSLEVA
jgi:O-antigen/teichoic acid export membrane protein